MIFFTSDNHFFHKNIIQYSDRPFQDVDDMNRAMIERWNEVVGPDDVVYLLGDMFLGKSDASEHVISCLNGKIRIVPGNHDGCHPMRTKREKVKRRFEQYGVEVLEHQLVLPEDDRFFLSHFPVTGDSGEEDRFPEWRPTPEDIGGRVLLHGHIHEKWRETYDGTKIVALNVGVDVNNFVPISLDSVIEEVGFE